jgi:hypothetical protein
MPRLRHELLLVALLGWAAPAGAEEPSSPADEVEVLLKTIAAAPPSPKVVVEIVRHPSTSDPEVARRVLAVLWHRGGYGATIGLQALARHRDPGIRADALRGVAAVGLRVRDGLRHVEDAVRSRDPDERGAALTALGRVGTGEHVPILLEALHAKDKPTLLAAYRALTTLTGAKNPWHPDRWEHWWSCVGGEARTRIDDALQAIESEASPTDVSSARGVLYSYGWIERDLVEETLREWIRSTSARLRIEGYRAARLMRLGDLAKEVDSAFRYEQDPVAWIEGRASAATLGVPIDGAKPPRASGSSRRTEEASTARPDAR